MRALPASALIAILAGCGATTAGPASAPAYIDASGSDVIINVSPGLPAAPLPVAAGAEAVWRVLPEAYAALGLADPAADASTRTLQTRNQVVYRRFAGDRPSAFFTCGTAPSGEPAADSYRLQVTVQTTVETAGEGSALRTVVQASARTVEGTGTAAVRCASNGRLETRIATLVRERVGT